MGLRDLHRRGTMALSVVMVIIGVALLAEAAAGVGGLTVRLLAGALFLAAGIGRLYVERRRGDGTEAGTDADAAGDRAGVVELPPAGNGRAGGPTRPRAGRRGRRR